MPETEDIDAKERDRRIAAALAEAEALEVEPKEPFDTVHQPPDEGTED